MLDLRGSVGIFDVKHLGFLASNTANTVRTTTATLFQEIYVRMHVCVKNFARLQRRRIDSEKSESVGHRRRYSMTNKARFVDK